MAAASAHAHNASASLAARGVPGRDQVDGLLTSEGTIYPLLTRLRKEQLVTTFWQESASGPPRRLEAAAADLPQERRIELLSEIEEHIEAALRERGRPPCATCSSASDRLTGTAMRTGRSRGGFTCRSTRVRTHSRRIRRKLGSSMRDEAVTAARRRNLL
jgi:hypothetical protein